jgi:hypothetical protein
MWISALSPKPIETKITIKIFEHYALRNQSKPQATMSELLPRISLVLYDSLIDVFR